jgi:hypothetical protein
LTNWADCENLAWRNCHNEIRQWLTDCLGKSTLDRQCVLHSCSFRSMLYNNPAAKECVDIFITHAVRPMLMLFQITGHNRARQRDKWARLLEDLAVLQDEV